MMTTVNSVEARIAARATVVAAALEKVKKVTGGEVRTLLVLALLGSLGCDYLRQRSDQQELDGLDLYIDLEIARTDKIAIQYAKMVAASARESRGKAMEQQPVPDVQAREYLNDQVDKADETLAKAIETAARHRHR
jgi:hypothetical protein